VIRGKAGEDARLVGPSAYPPEGLSQSYIVCSFFSIIFTAYMTVVCPRDMEAEAKAGSKETDLINNFLYKHCFRIT
jgi:hypothetical protein